MFRLFVTCNSNFLMSSLCVFNGRITRLLCPLYILLLPFRISLKNKLSGNYINLNLMLAGVGAAWKVANVEKGSTVAIFGLGAVGLAVSLVELNHMHTQKNGSIKISI